MRTMLPAVAVLLAVTVADSAGAADEPVWHTDYAKAKALAAKLKQPLFVVFR